MALYHLNELGDSAPQAVAVGEPLIEDLKRVLGPDHPDTLSARNSLADWLTGRQAGPPLRYGCTRRPLPPGNGSGVPITQVPSPPD